MRPSPAAGSFGVHVERHAQTPSRGPPRASARVVEHLTAGGVDEHRAGLGVLQQLRHRQSLGSPCVSARWTLMISARATTSSGLATTPTPCSSTACRRASTSGGEPPAPDHHRHAERAGTPRDLLPDAAESEQTERPAEQTARLRELLLVPFARAQLGRRCRTTRRSSASISANVSSATATAFLPGQFDT